MKYKINVNDSLAHEVELADGRFIINGEPVDADTAFISGERYHIISGSRSFMMEVLKNDIQEKKFTINVNGNIYQLKLDDELDMLLDKMGMSAGSKSKADNVKAPMPGLVLRILAEPGQAVNKGDSLIILEAMKMENVIKATGPGTVKAICVNEKDTVDKNQLLIEMI